MFKLTDCFSQRSPLLSPAKIVEENGFSQFYMVETRQFVLLLSFDRIFYFVNRPSVLKSREFELGPMLCSEEEVVISFSVDDS